MNRPHLHNYFLIPYCQRLDNETERLLYLNETSENIEKTLSFKELKQENISSEQLLQWFTPIDIAESYEMNLNDSNVFHNCSSPWFGSHCQYKFIYNSSFSLTDVIIAHLNHRTENNMAGGTCYPFINGCNSGMWPLCIDWREICDGKIDCLNGEDESNCNELEVNECDRNEYRCHYGGQCIPLSFLRENRLSVDCLDGSDEQDKQSFNLLGAGTDCPETITFRCEERIARYRQSFHCGDGQFVRDPVFPSLSSSCGNKRDIELSRSLVTSMRHIENVNCQKAFYCALHFNRTIRPPDVPVPDTKFYPLIENALIDECESLSNHCSSKWIVIPERPILFGLFQFVYFTNRTIDEFKENVTPNLLCFHHQQCPMLISKVRQKETINGLICFDPIDFYGSIQLKNFNDIISHFWRFGDQCLNTGIEKSCLNSSYFYCNQSMKCISHHRVRDGLSDCKYSEDETVDSCIFNDSTQYECKQNRNICFKQVTIGDDSPHCPSNEDETFVYGDDFETLVPYGDICNQFNSIILGMLSTNESDESNCDLWPCNNPYTRCDQTFDCLHGQDELDCPLKNCSINEHQCENISLCLSIDKIYEKYSPEMNDNGQRQVYYWNKTHFNNEEYFRWNNSQCFDFDRFSSKINDDFHSTLNQQNKCFPKEKSYGLPYEIVVIYSEMNQTCRLGSLPYLRHNNALFNFKTDRLGNFPSISINHSSSSSNISTTNEKRTSLTEINSTLALHCHRGIPVYLHSNKTIRCFCPPNYFGSRCQWQNQRISLTLQFIYRGLLSAYVLFQARIMLIDELGQITPYREEISYMPAQDCKSKYNIYLLYPSRPKSLSKNYSIQIDLFERIQMKYWTSWILSIPFQFLPVNRISSQLHIPEHEQDPINNKSSLICPLNKFGRYCHLTHSICDLSKNQCLHDGICIPTDHRIDLKGFTCFCRENYYGNRCQYEKIRLNIEFNENIIPNSSIVFLHFITAFEKSEHEQITIMKKVPFNGNKLIVYISQLFHILFVQREDNHWYYLAIVQERFHSSESISTRVDLNQRCSLIVELNETLSTYKYLDRVKYYPLLCRQYSEMMCFSDGYLMCICDLDRFSNCFLFNQTIKNDCQGENHCQNNGQCLHNNQTCPTQFTCVCPDCYYGSKCQFSTEGFLFSLDAILGYHIQPNLSINEQPFIIKMSIFLSIIMFLIGFINGFLSFLIFKRKIPRIVGSGNYLLMSSIVSFLMTLILTIKFWNLILTQQLAIANRSLLNLSCITLDVTLKILLTSNEWLNSCVAVERMITIVKTATFNKKASQKTSKWIILSIFVLTFLSYLHDPLHRQLIDDVDINEKRIWCFVQYSLPIGVYNFFINIFHFLIPFLINMISSIWIVISITRIRTGIQPDQTFQQHLKRQIHQHRHILYAPCLLIILSSPRLIISFVSGCMRSSRQPWLYLFAYFISFIPSMLTFFVFVVPSSTYKKEFLVITKQVMKRLKLTT